MKIELDSLKSTMENATHYFEEAKKLKKRIEDSEKALGELRKKVEKEKKKEEQKENTLQKKKFRIKENIEKEWFEKFHYFHTSGGFLVIGGRDAKQNEILVSKHLKKEDLFFHADIQGASAVILKTEGKNPTQQDKLEAAQFAACYSKAWQLGYGSIDVYCVKGEKVSKYSHGEYVAKGGFMILGKKEWFRNTELKLGIGIEEKGKAIAFPALKLIQPKNKEIVVPGSEGKIKISKEIAEKFSTNPIEIEKLIPGSCSKAQEKA